MQQQRATRTRATALSVIIAIIAIIATLAIIAIIATIATIAIIAIIALLASIAIIALFAIIAIPLAVVLQRGRTKLNESFSDPRGKALRRVLYGLLLRYRTIGGRGEGGTQRIRSRAVKDPLLVHLGLSLSESSRILASQKRSVQEI